MIPLNAPRTIDAAPVFPHVEHITFTFVFSKRAMGVLSDGAMATIAVFLKLL